MLIENFVNSMDAPLNALILLNEASENELRENYSEIKKRVSQKVINNLLGFNFLEKLLISYIDGKTNKIRNIIDKYYGEMLNNEFKDDYSDLYDFE